MYIHGDFINNIGDTVAVHIVTRNDRTEEIEIGAEGSTIFFTTDPVEITSQVNDTFDHLLKYQASIRLLTSNFVSDFFCSSARDAVVNIFCNDNCIFAGFIEPQAYEQEYNEVYDELELNCIDVLSATQYSKYRNIGSAEVLYSIVKSEATQRTFIDIALEILNNAISTIDILGGHATDYYYDGSKALDSVVENKYKIFEQLSISELLFLGKYEDDDTWQQDKVIDEMMRYLNLHIVQDGFTFYIFDWSTVKSSTDIVWYAINDLSKSTTTQRGVTTIETSIAAGTDTRISIGEVFNQLLLTCNTESVESIIESPLDEDLLVSPYTAYQKYLTEYSSDGNGQTAYDAFYNMTHDLPTTYDGGKITEWYLQVKSNKSWKFLEGLKLYGDLTRKDLYDSYTQNNEHQEKLPNVIRNGGGAALLSFGKKVTETAHDDNSPLNKLDFTNYLVFAVNGNGINNDPLLTYPQDWQIQLNIPYATYTGNITGGVFSPSDKDTKNYIVLSGKVILNPLQYPTGSYKQLHDTVNWGDTWKGMTVSSRTNTDGRYYAQQWFKALNPKSAPEWDVDTISGLVPYTEDGPQLYEFNYSAIGDSEDTISKVSVLACMLIIGNKCVVETGTSGQTKDFEWQTYKPLEECATIDEYYQQCFTIGFDPKIGDKLIGTEFDFQNNIDYTLGIDAAGIAIPIKKDDGISGQVKFMILGPVNTTWDVVTRRHPTWFRHTSWTSTSVALLAHISSIILKSFEVKVYSDNGLINNSSNNDLIYMSDTVETYVNKKDDLEMKINSTLTKNECQTLGVADTVKLSTPLNVNTKVGLLTIYDYNNNVEAKPEQIYVDSYYKEYHEPRILMSQKLTSKPNIIDLFRHYIHPALNKEFFVQGISRNLMEGYADLSLKEVNS